MTRAEMENNAAIKDIAKSLKELVDIYKKEIKRKTGKL